MRQVLLLSVLAMGLPGGCAGHRATSTAPVPIQPASAVPPAPAPEPDVFRAQVAPLLAQRCAPCHNPGGKMYESMPFDDPATITGHAEGILRRIKTPDEHALIEQWIASRPKS